MVVGEVSQSGACMGASLGSQSNLGAESENLSLWHQEIVSVVDGSRLHVEETTTQLVYSSRRSQT
jgi:hypothetical protein